MKGLERRIDFLEQERVGGCLNCEMAKLNGVTDPRCTADCAQTLREALSALNGYPENGLPEQRHASA